MNINNNIGVHNCLIRLSKIIAKNVNNPNDWKFCRDVLDNLVKGLNYGMPYKNNFKKRMEEDWANKKKKKNNFKLINLKDEIDERKKANKSDGLDEFCKKMEEIAENLKDQEHPVNKLWDEDNINIPEDDSNKD